MKKNSQGMEYFQNLKMETYTELSTFETLYYLFSKTKLPKMKFQKRRTSDRRSQEQEFYSLGEKTVLKLVLVLLF